MQYSIKTTSLEFSDNFWQSIPYMLRVSSRSMFLACIILCSSAIKRTDCSSNINNSDWFVFNCCHRCRIVWLLYENEMVIYFVIGTHHYRMNFRAICDLFVKSFHFQYTPVPLGKVEYWKYKNTCLIFTNHKTDCENS